MEGLERRGEAWEGKLTPPVSPDFAQFVLITTIGCS